MNNSITELEKDELYPNPLDPTDVPPEDLVPGPYKPLRIGYDDILIQHHAQDNMLKLDEEKNKDINQFYVVCFEYPVIPLSLTNDAIPKIEFSPVSLIYTNSMKLAIKKFEDEYGKRHWLPVNQNSRFDRQLGIPRIIADRSIKRVIIQSIRKDCVFGK